MPTCQYISKLKAGAIHFESHLDCSHEFRATYGVEVKRNGINVTDSCTIRFYVMKKIRIPPSPSDEGWSLVGTTCGVDQPDHLRSIDGEWEDNLPNQNFLWLKAHIHRTSELTIDLIGKATFKCDDNDGVVQWTCANHLNAPLYITLDNNSTTIPTPNAPSINSTTENNHPKIYWSSIQYAKSYKIYQKRGSGSFNYLAATPNLNYVDTAESIYMGSGPKETIYYKIKAANSCGNLSAYSNQKTFGVVAN